MARVKSWYTIAHASGSIAIPVDQGSGVIADNLVDPLVVRTRAFCALSYADQNVPPISPGNSNSPMVFRILISDAADDPGDSWAGESSGIDDVIFDPLIWSPQFYVPTSADLSRPEHIFGMATPAGGICDSKGQRKMPGGSVDVLVSWYAGAAPGTGAAGDPEFTSQMWIRCLIEATI